MFEQKLIVGRYIDLVLPPIAPPAYALGAFVPVAPIQLYLQESTGVFKKTSDIQVGTGPKAHRNFVWLPWLPGGISEVPLVGADVLTGPMSGCWLVTYNDGAGVRHAGHLGTDIASPAGTAAVNTAWNQFATANAAQVIGGFNPLRHWIPAQFPGVKGKDVGAPKIFGLFTTTNEYYIVVAYQQSDVATKLRIAGVQLTPSVTVGRLQAVDQPGP
jgi:hypothetical protein